VRQLLAQRGVLRTACEVNGESLIHAQATDQVLPVSVWPSIGRLARSQTEDELRRTSTLGGVPRDEGDAPLRLTFGEPQMICELEVLRDRDTGSGIRGDAFVCEGIGELLASCAVEAETPGSAGGEGEPPALLDALQVQRQVEVRGSDVAERSPQAAPGLQVTDEEAVDCRVAFDQAVSEGGDEPSQVYPGPSAADAVHQRQRVGDVADGAEFYEGDAVGGRGAHGAAG